MSGKKLNKTNRNIGLPLFIYMYRNWQYVSITAEIINYILFHYAI